MTELSICAGYLASFGFFLHSRSFAERLRTTARTRLAVGFVWFFREFREWVVTGFQPVIPTEHHQSRDCGIFNLES